MRPASEIHSALDLIDADLKKRQLQDDLAANNIRIARDVLAWVAGAHWTDLTDGENPWLCAFLLDDPPQLGPPPGDN